MVLVLITKTQPFTYLHRLQMGLFFVNKKTCEISKYVILFQLGLMRLIGPLAVRANMPKKVRKLTKN